MKPKPASFEDSIRTAGFLPRGNDQPRMNADDADLNCLIPIREIRVNLWLILTAASRATLSKSGDGHQTAFRIAARGHHKAVSGVTIVRIAVSYEMRK